VQTAKDPLEIVQALDGYNYVADEEFATALFLLLNLKKPLLLEGPPGVGKTEIALVLSQLLNTKLIRLQCYEGLDINSSVYEWNYQKQLLGIKLQEGSSLSVSEKEKHIFGTEYLLQRPLLQSISETEQSPVLLIDELDRSDEEFEAFLLELLSAFQISIPEIGTIKAKHKPYVVLTSNRSRELSDALKRRCLYYWIDYPSFEKELEIVRTQLPDAPAQLARQITGFIQALREMDLYKLPGVAETLDWTTALVALDQTALDAVIVDETLGAVLKYQDDVEKVKGVQARAILERIKAGVD